MRTNTRRRSPGFDITASFASGSEEARVEQLKGLTDRLETAARVASNGDVPQARSTDEDRSVVTSLHPPAREPQPQVEVEVDVEDDLPVAPVRPQARTSRPAAAPKRASKAETWGGKATLPAQGAGLGLKGDQLRFVQKTINIRPDQVSFVRQIAAIEALRNDSNITFTEALRVIIDLGLSQVSEHYAAEEERLG